MQAYLYPRLLAGETIQHFVKIPADNVHPGLRYIVITNQSVVECWFHDSGRAFRYPFGEFRGMRASSGYVRLAFNSSSRDDDDDVLCCDFFPPGGLPEFMAFYAKLAVAYYEATGLSFKEQVEGGYSSVPEIPLVADD